jgi:hypothetical protein
MPSVGEKLLGDYKPRCLETVADQGGFNNEQVNLDTRGRFFLARLERFAGLANSDKARDIPQWRRLARHATLSTYRDCEALGLRQEAKNILGKASGLNSQ